MHIFSTSHSINLALSIALAFCLCTTAKSQREYLVKVDPATGAYTKLDSIPGVIDIYVYEYSIIDEVHHTFLLVGTKDLKNNFLFSLNLRDGTIFSKAPFAPLTGVSALQILAYATTSKTLYCFFNDTDKQYLSTIDMATGKYTILKQVADLVSPSKLIFDSVHDQLIFKGVDTNSKFGLYIANAATGEVVKKIAPGNLVDIEYNNNLQRLYGVRYTLDEGFSLVTVDIAQGTVTTISKLPNEIDGFYQGAFTFDEIHNRYIFGASNSAGVASLYTIDANTGNIVYKSPAEYSNDVNKDNVIQHRFDNISGNLYALHWEAHSDTIPGPPVTPSPPFTVYPNPVSNTGQVLLDTNYNYVAFTLCDAQGRIIEQRAIYNTAAINFSVYGLATGIYFYTVICDNRIKSSGKIIVGHR